MDAWARVSFMECLNTTAGHAGNETGRIGTQEWGTARRSATWERARHHVDADHFDLAKAALDEMHEAGFRPEFGPGMAEQVSEIRRESAEGVCEVSAGVW